MLQVCVHERPGANADVMSYRERKSYASSEDDACRSSSKCYFENHVTSSESVSV